MGAVEGIMLLAESSVSSMAEEGSAESHKGSRVSVGADWARELKWGRLLDRTLSSRVSVAKGSPVCCTGEVNRH